ncbi:MAG: 5-(carboxyamino)imidazole ribonucleotide synthase, partial [Bdellovibrionota bacterium]
MIDPHQSPLGLLGSGQLGQMLIQSAKNHGYQVHVFDPAFQHSPCSLETSLHTEASFSDAEKVIAFSKQVSAVTYEFENIPLETAALVEKHSVLRPSSKVLETAQ